MENIKKTTHGISFLLFILIIMFVIQHNVMQGRAAASDNLSGYAWAETIGWISFNCTNTGSCGSSPYGVTAAADGTISGYAWAETIGWISFNAGDTAGCPSPPCTPFLDRTTGIVTGWAKALAGGTAQSGGWNGWIHLRGPSYGVSAVGCSWEGYAWGTGNEPSGGNGVVGWIHFSGAGYGVVGSGNGCGLPVVSFSQSENTTMQGDPYTLTWSGVGADSCTMEHQLNGSGFAPETFGNNFGGSEVLVDPSPRSIDVGVHEWKYECTNTGGSTSATVSHIVEAKQPLFEVYPVGGVPADDTINEGDPLHIHWTCYYSAAGPNNGGGFGFFAGNQDTGDIHPAGPSFASSGGSEQYIISCGNGGSAVKTIFIREPLLGINAVPKLIRQEETSDISWSASGVNSCDVFGPSGFAFDAPPPDLPGGATWSDTETTPPLEEQNTYTLECKTAINTYTAQVTVNVVPKVQEL